MPLNQFDQIVDLIKKKSPIHAKKIAGFISVQDDMYFDDANQFVSDYVRYAESCGISLESVVDSYLQLCNWMMKYQINFMKTGCYNQLESFKHHQDLYGDREKMLVYVIGLALSQFLWQSHYKIFKSFQSYLIKSASETHYYLEIGPGHGLFLKSAIEILQPSTRYSVVDLSPTALQMTRSMLDYFQLNTKNITYQNIDVLDFSSEQVYDFIAMGEVLEHLEQPEIILNKLYSLLAANGKLFISTCINCPFMDHVYHFKNVDQIRSLLNESGFAIDHENILPVENLPMEEIIERKITINYCTLLRKQ